ncbi:hypothetical protein BGX21_002702 [Mortierella sp. AD011]|nr:hypothetical protein BGX21_002702 [Mortierella sp. AD011]
MERIASSGSIKRPSSINSGSSYIPTSPVSSVAPVSVALHDDQFSNNPEDYEVKLPIGYGSSAVVYNAYYKPLNKRVAIKVIDLDMFERNQIDELRRETQVMALCKHPNVLRVNGAFVTDSKLYIVTPYLSAGSCLDIMKTAYPDGFDEISIATILKQALQGLDYLHKNGHIHRDVKAGNLLMDDDGSVLLADFGVSSSLMEGGDRRGTRKTFVGTPCWMAPEVMEQAGYDYKADIWSFGITAIELATGHAPFAKYPPIKVLMLTLSNDPPTLDRESTKHRYSKLLKEMIDSCLQKDPARRPSAEKLLSHSFFKQAKKPSHLVTTILRNLPPLEQRPQKKATQKTPLPQKGVSWDFDADDTNEPPVRKPRTVTFEPTNRPISTATTDSIASSGTVGTPIIESRSLDTFPDDGVSSQIATQAGDKPIKKSRFVVEDPVIPAGSSSPTSNYGTDVGQTSSDAISPYNAASSNSVQSGQSLHGLGVSSNGTAEQSTALEVKKGRFSVKDTLSIASPIPGSVKATAGNEALLSPTRSLTNSPIDGAADGVQIGAPVELGLSERKSRFEVHHNHAAPAPAGSTSTNGGVLNSPGLTNINVLPRDSSQSKISRFSVEPTQSSLEPAPNSATAPSIGTPNQSKRSRFQVSSVEGKPGEISTGVDASGSTNSTPNISPSTSLLHGQGALIEAQGVPFVSGHLETLYRQNEQQRAILIELLTGLGLKPSSSTISPSIATKNLPENVQPQSVVNTNTVATVVAAATTVNTSGGSIHRQENQSNLERQLQMTARENESLRRENEALKRELDRLRRGL